ncbi:MAG: ISL3 family transposase [Ktedonobacterales bacterium]
MNLTTLFRLPPGMRLLTVTLEPAALIVEAAARRGRSPCPSCQTLSDRVHSHYTRTVADLPCCGRHVILRLHVRKWRCTNAGCPQRIFTERFPGYLQPWARKTLRVAHLIAALGLAEGGRGAERIGRLVGVLVSAPTVLRMVMAHDPTPSAAVPLEVRVLGVDDFAFRRASRSGTLLMDLEQRHVIDLLPDRSQDAFAHWLQHHPEIRFISRDRGGDYAAAATTSAPQAQQIADRFHLLLNAGEVMERYLTRQHVSLREAARALGPVDAPRRTSKRTPADEQRRQERRAARKARYEHVVALHQEGLSVHQIAPEVGLARATIHRSIRAACFPERMPPLRPRQIDPSIPSLQDRWNAGEHHPRTLWREIHAQGYPANIGQVRRLVKAWRTPAPAPGVAGQPLPAKDEAIAYSPRQTRWLLTKADTALSTREARYLELLKHLCPQVAEAQRLLLSFHTLVAERSPARLDSWLAQCEQSDIAEFVRFARGVRRDYAAVRAALCYLWSQGPLEGQVNRLKLLKRQMYGRAGFPLLRRRVLASFALSS